MSLKNIKTNNQGFTIVELLIVVVVIAILAAITIVSYNGITNRANSSSAASNAETVQKVAEAFSSDCSRYPATIGEFRSGCTAALSGVTGQAAVSTLPASINVLRPAAGSGGTVATTGLTAANGTNSVVVFITGSAASPTGGVVVTWDYATGAPQVSTKYTYFGAATSGSTFIQIGI